ncbi:MAG: GTPase HflX, partial [Solobacterium sp.]|nr:GTPase HflX [Solobacterium sp.]
MKKVILAGMEKKNANDDFVYAMKETQNLCEACGYDVVATISQKSYSADPKTAFRKGKVDELAALVKDTEAELVIFHNGLSIQTAQRLSSILGVNVIDRTALILDIFSKRARSKQAKLQTELARLQYDLPQLLMDNQDSSGHERGGSALNRGAGEMRSQVIERRYAKRMNELKKELSKIKEQHYRDERRRTKTLMKRVGLVGYTNAGKSSLMNLLLEDANAVDKEVYSEDMLFATLDTSVRNIRISSYRFLLYDTVGFVSNLPHTLIEAFQSTLDAARDADLLLHIIDISDKDYEAKIQIT